MHWCVYMRVHTSAVCLCVCVSINRFIATSSPWTFPAKRCCPNRAGRGPACHAETSILPCGIFQRRGPLGSKQEPFGWLSLRLRKLLWCSALRKRRGCAGRQINQYENTWCCDMCGLAVAELANNTAKGITHSMETGNAGLWHQEVS